MLPLVCDVATDCGGCPQIFVSPAEQRRNKRQRVAARLAQAGFGSHELPWIFWDAPQGYRNRIRLRCVDGAPAFFNPHKSNECAVLEPELKRALREFRAWAVAHRSLLQAVEHLELRAPAACGDVGLVLQPVDSSPARRTAAPRSAELGAPEAPAALHEQLLHALPRGYKHWVVGSPTRPSQRCLLQGDVYTYVPLGGFRQVNTAVNHLLIAQVLALALELGCGSFGDLFCGSGNLSLPLLAAGLQGCGMEWESDAIGALQRAASEQGLAAQDFVAGDAHHASAQQAAHWPRCELLIVDPPRAGLKQGLAGVLALQPEHVLMCYCSESSFVRDVQQWRAAGFALQRVWLCDMFPHTEHVELLAQLQRCA